MNFLGFTITKKVKPITTESKPTLVVTGCCSDTELKHFEEHCKDKGQTVIATKLPVLGVFNMQDPSVVPRTQSEGTGLT